MSQFSIYISSLTADGEFIRAGQIGVNSYNWVERVIHDGDDNLIMNAKFAGTTDFDPGPGVTSLTSTAIYPSTDIFLVKFSASNYSTSVTFRDSNGDGIQQPGEPVMPLVVMKATGSGGENYYAVSNAQGKYSIETPGGSYTITPALPLYYSAINPASHSAIFGTGLGQQDTANHFGLRPAAITRDLKISINNLGPARAGRPVLYRLTYTNAGTDTASGTITLRHDNLLSFGSATPSPISYTSPLATWNFSNLGPGISGNITAELTPAIVPAGTILKLYATVNTAITDFDPSNNTDSLYQAVVASLDPNDKTVTPSGGLPIGYINNGGYLDYKVRFQNTGNDTAFLVVIRDTLSNNLMVSSFEMIAASHPYTVDMKGNGVVEWRFNNILLPDSNVNEARSHGFVRYRVKPKSTLVAGNEIKNTASIYFDYNAPVLTNETSNIVTVVTAVGNPQPNELAAKLFPNPAGSVLVIQVKGKFNYTIYDLMGKRIRSVQNNTDEATVDVSTFSKGMYIVEIESKLKKVQRTIVVQ